MFEIVFTKQAAKDLPRLTQDGQKEKASAIMEILKANPFQTPPAYEKLAGDMAGLYARRINRKHRLVYQVYEEEQTVKIVSVWSHYER